MKNKVISTKKIFITLLLVVSFLFLGNIAVFSSLNKAKAYVYQQESSSISVGNGDFTSYTSGNTGAPYSLTDSWTITKSSTVTAGVIDISTSNFQTNNSFGLSSNPKTDEAIDNADNYILMFRSNEDELGKASAVSDKITLTASKYFRLNIHVKTVDNALASIYLSADSTQNFLNVSTGNLWKTYSFYIATDTLDELDTTISLCYGASKTTSTSGAVLYDCVEVFEISNADFYSTNNSGTAQSRIINKSRVSTSPFLNSNFENGLTNWEVSTLTGNGQASVSANEIAQINATLNGLYNNNGSKKYADTYVYGNTKNLLLLNNDVQTTSISSTKNNLATAKQHSFYTLTFLLKTGQLSGSGITVTLTPENYDASADENLYEPLVITGLSSSTGLSEYNGFEIKTIYIKGSVENDQKYYITFSLPSSSGYAIIDDITLTPLTQQEYTDKAGDSNALDFSSNITDTDTITNGNFWFSDNETLNETYPLKPLDWTYSADTNNAKSGIIRINPAYFTDDSANYGYPANPGVDISYYEENYNYPNFPTGSNNLNESVLMIRNTTRSDASYESESFTISANTSSSASTVKISVGVKTVGSAKAFIKLLDEDGNVVAIIDNISSTNWDTYTIYIKNGLTSMNVTLVLGVNGNGGNNYSFFDFVQYSSSSSDSLSKMTSNTSFYLNLTEDSFYSHSNELISNTTNVYKNTNFSTYSATEGSNNYFGVKTENVREDANDLNVLFVNNVVEGYQILISNYAYSLTLNSYYEISVWIKTDFSGTSLNGELFGGYFEVVALDSDGNIVVLDEDDDKNTNIFSNIVVSSTDSSEWVKYSMFILCESSQEVKILLGMGTKENPTQGKVYFDDLTVTSIEKTVYAEKVEGPTTIVSKTIELSDEEEDEDTSSSSEESSVNVWAFASSIILGVAILFALAGYAIRQIPKKKVKKVSKKNNYVISIKKVKQKDIKEELKIKREKDLIVLNENLSKIKNEYQDLREKFDQDTLGKDEVESRSIYKTFAISSNVLLSKIEYLNSAIAYLNDPFNIRQTEKREMSKRNKQNKLEYVRQLQEEYEKINDKEKTGIVKNNVKKKMK
ncbi:MAG: hypothetical protein EOM55_03585 [Clostridia bacterium]|nr:hypothetical protein [Clostridia bacterium]